MPDPVERRVLIAAAVIVALAVVGFVARESVRDAWDWVSYHYQRWRRGAAEDSISLTWLLPVLLLVPLLAWRLRASLRRSGGGASKRDRPREAGRPGSGSP